MDPRAQKKERLTIEEGSKQHSIRAVALGQTQSVPKHFSNVFFKYLTSRSCYKMLPMLFTILLWSLPQNVFWKQPRMFYCMALIGGSLKVHRLNSEKDLCCFPALFFWALPLQTASSLRYTNAAVLYISLY